MKQYKIPLDGIEGSWDPVEESLDLETNISSSLGNCSSIFEPTFVKASSCRETEQRVEKKGVQNQKGDEVI